MKWGLILFTRRVERVPQNALFSVRGGLLLFFKLLILLLFFTKKPLSLYCVGCPKSYFVLGLFVNTETSVKRQCIVHALEAVQKVSVEQ